MKLIHMDEDYADVVVGGPVGYNDFVVQIMRTDEGVVVDVYEQGVEDAEPVAGTWAHFSETTEAAE